MSCDDESGNSIPYIDDTTTGEEDLNQDQFRHSVNITEKYRHRNRSIRIKDRSSEGPSLDSSGPVAPLAEIDLANDTQDDEPEPHRMKRFPAKDSVVKLVIKGWNSTVSIQGLDNKSSITFKRKPATSRQEKEIQATRDEGILQDAKKPKKKRWKMLTKSLISKSARYDRRGLDERYPKYVLLKDEEEEEERKRKSDKENRIDQKEVYPKMVVLSERRSFKDKNTKKIQEKTEFHIKRTFKNKTNPLQMTDKTMATDNCDKEVVPERKGGDDTVETKDFPSNRMTRRKDISNKREIRAKSMDGARRESVRPVLSQDLRRPSSQDNVFYEIQGVLKEALQFCPNGSSQQERPDVCRPATCRFCDVMTQSYQPYGHHMVCCDSYRKPNIPLSEGAGTVQDCRLNEDNHIQIGIVSGFFPPPVMTMETFLPEVEACSDRVETSENPPENKSDPKSPTLIVSVPDLQMKSKPDPVEDQFQTSAFDSISDKLSTDSEENKIKIDESETTKYLQYEESHKKDGDNDESTTTTCTLKTDEENKKNDSDEKAAIETGQSDNLPLTQIGYKMYDDLTKLSLKREKEIVQKPETEVERRGENPMRNSRCNITFESKDSVIRIFVPEKKFNFKIDTGRSDIQIGLNSRPENTPSIVENDDKMMIKQTDLWHSNAGLKVSESVTANPDETQDYPNIKLAIGNEKEVLLSIERHEKMEKKSDESRKLTKEMNVGTDDLEQTGSDENQRKLGENFNRLSPRKSRLLRNLKDKLEERGKMINYPLAATATAEASAAVSASMATKKTNKMSPGERPNYPGIFLVRKIRETSEKPFEVSSTGNTSRKDFEIDQVREYYCEDCMATMRIFQDENPSVKSMVNKFETIIQLESF